MRASKIVTGISLTLLLATAACDRQARTDHAETTPTSRPTTATMPADVSSPTLAAIKQRGHLNCGVNQGLVGFAFTDNRGAWRGFDVDFCRATAAAIFGDPDAVRFVPLTAELRFEALRDGRVDVLTGEGVHLQKRVSPSSVTPGVRALGRLPALHKGRWGQPGVGSTK